MLILLKGGQTILLENPILSLQEKYILHNSHQMEVVILNKVLLRVSFSGDIQNPPGQGALQPTVGDPALTGGLD